MQFTYLSLLLAATSVIAAPLQARQTANGPSTCGNNYYSADQLSQAAQAGYSDYQSGAGAGGSTYPHKYNDYEGFNFPVSGPYEEFPILESGIYNGGQSSRLSVSIALLTLARLPRR